MAFAFAVMATALVASIVQTQVSIAALTELGMPVTFSARAMATLEDLARFGPVMAAIVTGALLPALLVGDLVTRLATSTRRTSILCAASVLGLVVAFKLLALVTPMPALVAATRGPIGFTLLCLTGTIGGSLYAYMTHPHWDDAVENTAAAGTDYQRRLVGTVLVVLPVLAFLVMVPGQGGKVDAVDPGRYVVQTIASGLNRPWSVAILPDGRRLVTELGGRLLVIGNDGVSSTVAVDGLPPVGPRPHVAGLMDVVLDPEFASNGLLYLTMGYGEPDANGTRIVRAKLAGNRVQDVRVIFSSTPKSSSGGNGGRMAFLRDGTLVLTLGDGSVRREEAQNLSNHLGKLVRIDREGRPPPDNPFREHPGTAPEIYSLGHRNPQGIAVDPSTGALLSTEHGARGGDEVNTIAAGNNYGWPLVTGGIDYSFAHVTPLRQLDGYSPPTLEWTPSIAPAGLAIYDGGLFPDWQGDLLVPALKERTVRRVRRVNGRIVSQELLLADRGERMRDVKVAPDGSVYVLTDGADATLLRLVPPPKPNS